MFQTLCSATASTAAATAAVAAALWHTRLTRKLWAVPWSSGKILTWQGYVHRSLASYLHLWPAWLWSSRNFSSRGSTSVYDHVNCFVQFFLVGRYNFCSGSDRSRRAANPDGFEGTRPGYPKSPIKRDIPERDKIVLITFIKHISLAFSSKHGLAVGAKICATFIAPSVVSRPLDEDNLSTRLTRESFLDASIGAIAVLVGLLVAMLRTKIEEIFSTFSAGTSLPFNAKGLPWFLAQKW